MLVDLLELEQLDDNRFRSDLHQTNFRKTLFGGQVLAQALKAAGNTVASRPPHSLHAYFLRPGSADLPIEFEVERVRDGGTVTNRFVKVSQAGSVIYTMMASFHCPETGLEHQRAMPGGCPAPERLRPSSTREHCPLAHTIDWINADLVEMRPCNGSLLEEAPSASSRAEVWIRSGRTLPDDPLVHYCALAFASDIGLLASAFLGHEGSLFSSGVFAASMDHALWFHAQPNFNEWHLYSTTSPWAGGARAFCRGTVYDRSGRQVASCAQEGLIRLQQVPLA